MDMPTLDWVGKSAVVNHHYEVPYHFLDRKYGDDERNMIIHGDNLIALKSLLPRFEGQIKCIYIDPPYNTGNEGWVYNDAVNDPSIKKWLGEVVGREGEDFTRHDKWLCMMYPRLRLMQRLLSEDGAIFISIDDNEQANLKLVCDEIFGAQNFVAQCGVKRSGARQDSKFYAVVHEYILCYAKNISAFVAGKDFKEPDSYPKFDAEKKKFYKTQLLRKWGSNSRRADRPNLFYPITAPDGSAVYPMLSSTDEGCWRWSRDRMAAAIDDGRVEFVQKGGDWIAYEKIFEPTDGAAPKKKFTTWIDDGGTGADTLKNIFGGKVFDYPKSVELIDKILRMGGADRDALVLDAFAGSGTTAHAVINLNAADQGSRRFILIESQPYAETITAERVRRVAPDCPFSFCEIGAPLFIDDRLNPDVTLDQIRAYVYFSETRQPLPIIDQSVDQSVDRKYFLGIHDGVSYYYLYDRPLDTDFLYSTLYDGGDERIIYAPNCVLGRNFLSKYRAEFKRIPSDIMRL